MGSCPSEVFYGNIYLDYYILIEKQINIVYFLHVCFIIPVNSFFLNLEPSFPYKSITKNVTVDNYLKNEENPVSILWLDPTFLKLSNIFMQIVLIGRNNRKKERKKIFSLQLFRMCAILQNILWS